METGEGEERRGEARVGVALRGDEPLAPSAGVCPCVCLSLGGAAQQGEGGWVGEGAAQSGCQGSRASE